MNDLTALAALVALFLLSLGLILLCQRLMK
jgi:hypothetical protein